MINNYNRAHPRSPLKEAARSAEEYHAQYNDDSDECISNEDDDVHEESVLREYEQERLLRIRNNEQRLNEILGNTNKVSHIIDM